MFQSVASLINIYDQFYLVDQSEAVILTEDSSLGYKISPTIGLTTMKHDPLPFKAGGCKMAQEHH